MEKLAQRGKGEILEILSTKHLEPEFLDVVLFPIFWATFPQFSPSVTSIRIRTTQTWREKLTTALADIAGNLRVSETSRRQDTFQNPGLTSVKTLPKERVNRGSR